MTRVWYASTMRGTGTFRAGEGRLNSGDRMIHKDRMVFPSGRAAPPGRDRTKQPAPRRIVTWEEVRHHPRGQGNRRGDGQHREKQCTSNHRRAFAIKEFPPVMTWRPVHMVTHRFEFNPAAAIQAPTASSDKTTSPAVRPTKELHSLQTDFGLAPCPVTTAVRASSV